VRQLVIDRFDPGTSPRSRVAEAIEKAYARSAGHARFVPRAAGEVVVLGEAPACPEHGPLGLGPLTPKHFSFNGQLGACDVCGGLGQTRQIVADRLFPERKKGFWDGLDRASRRSSAARSATARSSRR
jgi:excinuclease ABC subunit A